jgi:small subunit ribosomal protein S4
MIRKKKSYARPMKPFESGRIAGENELVKKYGLKNKKEVWKALAKVNYFRKRAMALAREKDEEQKVFFDKLRAIGLKIDSTADVLDLQVEDLLKRRLPTIVAGKGMAEGVRHARQMVVHKKILVDGKVVNSPSYIVSVELEGKIGAKVKKKVVKPVEKEEEAKEGREDKDMTIEAKVESVEAKEEKVEDEEQKVGEVEEKVDEAKVEKKEEIKNG